MSKARFRLDRRSAAIVSAACFSGLACGKEGVFELDRFGGWKGKRFEATGFFGPRKRIGGGL
ncbi:MAG: hypothetical protein AAFX06_18810 [Planctomycetota bacterium]